MNEASTTPGMFVMRKHCCNMVQTKLMWRDRTFKPHLDGVHLCYYLMFPSINDHDLSSWAQSWHRAAVTTSESLTYARLSARGPGSKVKCHMLSIPTCTDRPCSTGRGGPRLPGDTKTTFPSMPQQLVRGQ